MSTVEKYFGNYVGVVIQNNDPEKRGRVKVFVPHISYGVYKNWDQIELDKLFNSLSDPQLSDILAQLREVLPWAEVAGPLFGGNASGRYNSVTKSTYTDNSTVWNDTSLATGNRPAAAYTGEGTLHDAFNESVNTGILNPYSFEYTPSDYSSLAAGMFTVPNVGAHVWVFFENGDHNSPVYFASSYSQADYKRIYTTDKYTDKTLASQGAAVLKNADASVDYPSEYENSVTGRLTPESKTFRAKHVINTNKHAIELIDTDNREILKLTHFSGSFKEWNNYTTIELATNNDQKLVLGDQFETVRRTKNVAVDGDRKEFIKGDTYLKVGDFDFAKLDNARTIIDSINKFKQLFDTRRVGRNIYGRRSRIVQLDKITGVNGISPYQIQMPLGGTPGLKTVGGIQYFNGYKYCPICKNIKYKLDTSTWTMSYTYEAGAGGTATPILIEPTEAVIYPDLQKLENKKAFSDDLAGIGYYKGGACDICNSDYLDEMLRRPGFSPSTEYGLYEPERHKQVNGSMHTFYLSKRKELNELLATFEGGDFISEIHKNKIENVGLVMNMAASYRVDPIGKMRAESIFVAPEQVYPAGKPTPHVEPVDVSEVPGGNYIVTAGNKLKFVVGAKGINIKTFGPIDMYGSILNITGEQINIGSQNEIHFDAGEKLLIRARRTTIVSKDHEPVLIESPLHVSRNAIVAGGLYVDGEFGVRHISSLREIAYTSGPFQAPPTGEETTASTSGTGETGTATIASVETPSIEASSDRVSTMSSTVSSSTTMYDISGIGYENIGGTTETQTVSALKSAWESATGWVKDQWDNTWDSVKNVTGAVTGGALIGGLIGGVTGGLLGGALGWMSKQGKASIGDVSASLQALATQMATFMAEYYNHVHLYERIPTRFFDSAETLRAYLNDPSNHPNGGTINGRNVLIAAAPAAPFSGVYSTVVDSALKAVGWFAAVDGRIRAEYGRMSTACLGCIAATSAGSYEIVSTSSEVVNNTVTAGVFMPYTVTGAPPRVLKGGGAVAVYFEVVVPVKTSTPTTTSTGSGTAVSSVVTPDNVEYSGGSITTTYKKGSSRIPSNEVGNTNILPDELTIPSLRKG